MGRLSAAHGQLVQVARALAFDCRVLVLDEPTTALTSAEADHLFRVLDDLRHRGVTILYVSHRLPEVFRLCDRMTVLRDGQYAGTFDHDARRVATSSTRAANPEPRTSNPNPERRTPNPEPRRHRVHRPRHGRPRSAGASEALGPGAHRAGAARPRPDAGRRPSTTVSLDVHRGRDRRRLWARGLRPIGVARDDLRIARRRPRRRVRRRDAPAGRQRPRRHARGRGARARRSPASGAPLQPRAAPQPGAAARDDEPVGVHARRSRSARSAATSCGTGTSRRPASRRRPTG